MAVQIPYWVISGLPAEAQRELRRDFQELANAANSSTSLSEFDAIIDPSLAADSPGTGRFKTVAAALLSLKGAAWATNRSVNLGMVGRYTTSAVTETTLIASGDAPAYVRIVGLGGSWNNAQDAGIVWNTGAFTHVFTNLLVDNLTIQSPQTIFSCSVLATRNCRITSTNGSGNAILSGGTNGAFHVNSYLLDIGSAGAYLHMSGGALIYSGTVSGNRVAIAGAATFEGTSLHTSSASPAASTGFNFTGSSVGGNVVCGTDSLTAGPSAGAALQFSGSNMVIGLNVGQADTTSALGFAITVTGSFDKLSLIGFFQKMTIPAASTQAANIQGYIQGTGNTDCDITGPANINLTTAGRCTLRGTSVSGTVTCTAVGGAGQAFAAIGLVDSALMVTGLRPAASSTQKFYDLDANTKRVVITFAGGNKFPTAPTNAGATQYIVTEAGGTVVP